LTGAGESYTEAGEGNTEAGEGNTEDIEGRKRGPEFDLRALEVALRARVAADGTLFAKSRQMRLGERTGDGAGWIAPVEIQGNGNRRNTAGSSNTCAR
jgi:hypothetical protein